MHLSTSAALALAWAAAAVPMSGTTKADKRQWGLQYSGGACEAKKFKQNIGNGSPVQRYLYTQLTTNHECNRNEGCEIAASTVHGTSVAWSAGVSVDGFFSGGFEVAEYSETGEMPNCYGAKGDKICLWQRTAHTAYQVSEFSHDRCTQKDGVNTHIRDFTYTSPNKGGVGSSYVCAKGKSCRNKGYTDWGGHKKNGGPQAYPWALDVELTG